MKINLVFDGNFLYHLSFSIFSTYYRNEDLCEVLDDREKRQVLIRKCVMNLCAAVRRFGDDVNRVVVVIDSRRSYMLKLPERAIPAEKDMTTSTPSRG